MSDGMSTPLLLGILGTSVANLISHLRQSRCTELHSECCCAEIDVKRDVPTLSRKRKRDEYEDDEEPESPISKFNSNVGM